MGKLDGKVALITGGGTGIGRATALRLAEDGADVAVNYSRSKDDAETTAADIQSFGRNALTIQADVADNDAVVAMVDKTVDALGRLDILVNSAGMTRAVPLPDLDAITDEDWDRLMAVNVKGVFYTCRAAIKAMRQTDGGSIVNVASIAGSIGQGSSAVYCASKAACISLTKSLAIGQAPDISVNTVSPGCVETRWVKGWEEFTELHRQGTPLQRNANPEDCANAIYGLITSPFVTGQDLTVDGGRTLWLSAVRD